MTALESSGTLTVLFTDLVGSTGLMTRLGDVAFDRLRSEHFSRLRKIIADHGGREVKNMGDGVLATFGSTVEALACAVDVQRATEAHGSEAGVALASRVGISAGEVTFDSGDVFGRPVVEAARLVAAARPGQILASAVVAILAGSRLPVPVTQLGTMELKGLPEPLQVCTVSWEPAIQAGPIPLPPLLAGAGSVFVARDRERERLSRLWKEAVAGERRLALVAGEPGIGKTHLAAHVAGSVHGRGGVVLAGRCDEDLGVPYQPFVESLRAYVLHAARPRLGRHAGELVRLVPELGGMVAGLPAPLRSDPETERYRLFDAVAAWLAHLSTAEPVLLVVDDLHWAAKPTLLLLRHVLHFPEPLRLLVIATYRDTDIGRRHPLSDLLADLRRETGVDRLTLTGLSAPEVLGYLEAAGGHALSDEEGTAFARAVHEETDGNPFFLREVLRHLAETGGIAELDGRWSTTMDLDELAIPEGVRDVVGRRLSRLSAGTNRVLTEAAVIGTEFELVLLAPVCGIDDDDLLAALEEAAASRLVTEVPSPTPRYRFAHTLVRATLYDELSSGRRVRLHRRVAEAIESVYAGRLADHLPALAHHYGRAAAPTAESTKAVGYALQAGARALELLAHDEAVAWYQRALDLLDASARSDDAARLEVLLALGEAQQRAADPAHRDTLLDAAASAERMGDTGSLVRAALTNTRGVVFNTAIEVDDARVAVLEAALRSLGDVATPERARLLAQLGLELTWAPDRDRRVRCSDEALAIARRSSDPVLLAGVLLPRFYTIWSPATLEARLADTAELLDLAEINEDPVLQFQAAWLRFRAALEACDAGEARRCQQITAELAADLRRPLFRWLAGWSAAGAAHLDGRLQRTLEAVQTSLDTGRALGLRDAKIVALTHQATVVLTGEDVPGFEALATQVVGDTGSAFYRCYLALHHSQNGNEDAARAILAPFGAAGFSAFQVDVSWMQAVAAAARLAHNLGDVAAAERLVGLLSPYAHQIVVAASMPSGSVSHYLGLLAMTLGDDDRAEECFAAAARTHAAMAAPALLAGTRVEWAAMLLARGREDGTGRARVLLAQAAPVAAELGLPRLAQRIEALRAG